jgi:ABC-type lipoprotein export system ATPase subunit
LGWMKKKKYRNDIAEAALSSKPADQALIQAVGLKKVYKRGSEDIVALQGINLNIFPGEFIVTIGPSGSGKSTLLHLLGGVDRPTQGQLVVNGLDLVAASEAVLTRFRRDNIGFVFQFYNLLPSLNALDNVILPLLAKGLSWKAARVRGTAMLEQVGLGHRSRHTPAQLSGGEQQRVAIARAMVVEPSVILADEPTGDLDSASANSIVSLMVDLNRRLGVTFIVATHNLNLLKVATRAFELSDGLLNTASTA